MNDQKIFKIALLMSLIGIVGMILTQSYVSPQMVQIKDLNPSMVDKEVMLEAVVMSISKSKSGNTYFIDLTDGTGKIKLVIFEAASNNLVNHNLTNNINGRRIRVVGKVAIYHGAPEIILKDSKSLKII